MSSPKHICGASTWNGDPCKNPAGFRTFHEGIGECYLHHKISMHESRKINKGRCMPKSIYEECALIELRDSAGVSEYFYEPTAIPYNYTSMKNELFCNYIPDILVIYTYRKPVLIEVKTINEMCDSINLAKFKAANKAAIENNCEFAVWGYKSMEKTIYTYEKIMEECC